MDYVIDTPSSSNIIYLPHLLFANYFFGLRSALLAAKDLTPAAEAPPSVIESVTAETGDVIEQFGSHLDLTCDFIRRFIFVDSSTDLRTKSKSSR
jgi:hypothetical protein